MWKLLLPVGALVLVMMLLGSEPTSVPKRIDYLKRRDVQEKLAKVQRWENLQGRDYSDLQTGTRSDGSAYIIGGL
jgi:hypothetical protein